jgi:hypothetical protein
LTEEKLRALANFYREEFERHVAQLELSGIVGDDVCAQLALGKMLQNLDSVCCSSQFASLAETLLQRFDTLTNLSQISPRQGH